MFTVSRFVQIPFIEDYCSYSSCHSHRPDPRRSLHANFLVRVRRSRFIAYDACGDVIRVVLQHLQYLSFVPDVGILAPVVLAYAALSYPEPRLRGVFQEYE
jgi:hypothetical protein